MPFHLPRGNLETKVEGMIDRAQKVVVFARAETARPSLLSP